MKIKRIIRNNNPVEKLTIKNYSYAGSSINSAVQDCGCCSKCCSSGGGGGQVANYNESSVKLLSNIKPKYCNNKILKSNRLKCVITDPKGNKHQMVLDRNKMSWKGIYDDLKGIHIKVYLDCYFLKINEIQFEGNLIENNESFLIKFEKNSYTVEITDLNAREYKTYFI